MNKIIKLSLILFSLILPACGGGGGSGNGSAGSTPIVMALAFEDQGNSVQSSSVRTEELHINRIKLQVSGSGFETMSRVIPISLETMVIEERFDVPNGSGRIFEAFAYDVHDTVLYEGQTVADLNGTITTVTDEVAANVAQGEPAEMITVVLTPVTENIEQVDPPQFDGLSSATPTATTEITLTWEPATDNMTNPDEIVYDIYMATTPGGQDFSSPDYRTPPGATSYTITVLDPDTIYYFVVRAEDNTGNTDINRVEESANTNAGVDSDGDGYYASSDCNDGDVTIYPGANDANCDGIDQNCDGIADDGYVLDSSCGVGICRTTNTPSSCVNGVETICQPGAPTETTEVSCSDGLDNDCDGLADGADTMDCPTCTPTGFPDNNCDAIDDDCNGTVDDGYVSDASCGVGACQTNNTPSSCTGGVETTCLPGTPATTDIPCDGIDQDCNGTDAVDTTCDSTAPSFVGVASVTQVSGTEQSLTWQSATDEITLPANMIYLIYQATSPGGQNFAVPVYTTTPGATSYAVTGLNPSLTYYFVVRARDENGNIDQNLVERTIYDSTITNIASGHWHTLALEADGRIRSWGSNSHGELGNSTNEDSTTPVLVGGLPVAIKIAGGDNHTLAIKNDGTVWGWGENRSGQLGLGNAVAKKEYSIPVQVVGLTGITAEIAAGDSHSVALDNNGTVWTWGSNGNGQLGNGSTLENPTPAPVPGLTGVQDVAAGDYHTLALMNDGTVRAWGWNGYGQLGNGANNFDSYTPVQVTNLDHVIAISAGLFYSMALKDDGTVWAWGGNWDGELGIGTFGNIYTTPVQVTTLTGVQDIAAGSYHALALMNDGTVWTWGANWNGQLGDKTTSNRSTPVSVPGISNITQIAAGSNHSIALRSDGSVWTWGVNWNGQLGNGTMNESHVPVKVNFYQSWGRSYGGTSHDYALSIQQTTDGGYVVAGYTESSGQGSVDAWVLKLNGDGTIAWQKTYGGTLGDYAISIRQTTDGGYVVAGTTESSGQGGVDAWVLKLNSDGTVAWQKTFGGASNEYVYSIQQTTDGGYIVAGKTYSSGQGSGDAWVLKLNSDGTIAWQKTNGGTLEDFVYSIQQTTDGGYIVAGTTDSSGQGGVDAWVLKLNSDGTIAWQKTFGGASNEYVYSIQQTTDGGYIVAGKTYSSGQGSGDAWVLKLNSDGTIAWQKTYGGASEDFASSIRQTTDGGYVVAAYTESSGQGGVDAWVLKLNGDGTIAWQKTYGGVLDDYAISIRQTTDGGYAVAGATYSYGKGIEDSWVLKLTPDGTVGCGLGQDSTAIVTNSNVTPVDTNFVPVNTTVTGVDTAVAGQDSSYAVSTQCETVYMQDTDFDTLTDNDEITIYGTDPLDIDSDNDGFTDGEEIHLGTNPLDGQSFPAATTAPDYVRQGMVHYEDGQIVAAKADFEMALTLDPANQDAKVGVFFTLPFLVFEDPEVISILEGFNIIVPTATELWEVLVGLRSSFEFFGFPPPVNIPAMSYMQDVAERKILPELDRMISLLRDLEGTGYVFELTPALFRQRGETESAYLDDGEFFYTDALLSGLKSLLYIVLSYHFDYDNSIVDADSLSIFHGPDGGTPTPESTLFFILKNNGAAKMGTALTSLGEAVDSIMKDYYFIRDDDPDSDTDNGIQLPLEDYDNDGDIDADDESERDRLFNKYTGYATDLFINRVPVSFVLDINDTPNNPNDDITVNIDASKFFTDPLDRTDLPQLAYDLPRDPTLSNILMDTVAFRIPNQDVDGDGDPVGDWDDEFAQCYTVPTTGLPDDTLNGIFPDGLFNRPDWPKDGLLPVANALPFPVDKEYGLFDEYGMTTDGTSLYVSTSPIDSTNTPNSLIYEVDPANGNILGTPLNTPIFDLADLAYDGSNLWACGGRLNLSSSYENGVYKLDINGNVMELESFIAPPDTFPDAIAYDGNQGLFYVALALSRYGSSEVFVLDPATGVFGPLTYSNASFNVPSDFVTYNNIINTNDRISAFGSITSAGDGLFDALQTYSHTSLGANQSTSNQGSISVDPDGRYRAKDIDDISGSREMWGVINLDNGLFMDALLYNQNNQRIGIGLMRPTSGGYSNADLTGIFNHAGYINRNNTSRESFIGTLSFDGNGGFSMMHRASDTSNGADLQHSFTGSYQVNPNGTFTMTYGGDINSTREGSISADGNTLIFSQTNDQGRQRIGIALRQPDTATYSNADLQGVYNQAGYQNKDNTVRESFFGTITFDGYGGYEVKRTTNSSAPWAWPYRSHTGTYSVNPDGTFTLSKDNALYPIREGAISSDGNTLIISQTNTPYRQRIWIGMKAIDITSSSLYSAGLWDIVGLTFDGTDLWIGTGGNILSIAPNNTVDKNYTTINSDTNGLAKIGNALYGADHFRIHQFNVIP